MSILVIAEHDNSALKGSTLNTVAAATNISGDITLMVAGHNIDSVIDEAKTIDSIANILKCDDELYANAIAEELSSLVLSNCEGFTHILLSLIHI